MQKTKGFASKLFSFRLLPSEGKELSDTSGDIYPTVNWNRQQFAVWVRHITSSRFFTSVIK